MNWTKRVLIPLLTIVGISITLTVLCGFAYYAFLAKKSPIRLHAAYDTPKQLIEDKKLGFIMKPYLNKVLVHVGKSMQEVFTDENGNRAVSSDVPRVSRAEIVSIGCSQTWGYGVPADKTYSHVVGQLLQLSSANLGVSSYGGGYVAKEVAAFLGT